MLTKYALIVLGKIPISRRLGEYVTSSLTPWYVITSNVSYSRGDNQTKDPYHVVDRDIEECKVL